MSVYNWLPIVQDRERPCETVRDHKNVNPVNVQLIEISRI